MEAKGGFYKCGCGSRGVGQEIVLCISQELEADHRSCCIDCLNRFRKFKGRDFIDWHYLQQLLRDETLTKDTLYEKKKAQYKDHF